LRKRGGVVGAGLMLPLGYRVAPAGVAPGLPRFVDELPDLLGNVVTPVDDAIEFELREVMATAHRDLAARALDPPSAPVGLRADR